jgi:transposase-like protein
MTKAPTPRKRRGPKSKLTPELIANLARVIRATNSLEDAAAHCGVHRTTFFLWLQWAREGKGGVYRELFDAIEQAKADRRINFAAQLHQHGKKNWQALAWLAERTDPKHFGLRIKVHVQEELEEALDALEQGLSPDEYRKVVEILATRDASGSGEEVGDPEGERPATGARLPAGVGAATDAALHASGALEPAHEPD